MQLRDVMTKKVEVVSLETTVQEAAVFMKKCDVGSLPVCQGDHLEGIITDRDIVTRVLAIGKDPNSTKVHDVMTKHVHSVFNDENVETAAHLMGDQQIRRLVVVDREDHIVGIVSLGDLAASIDDMKMVGKTLEGISECS